jgi:hypothetical protein
MAGKASICQFITTTPQRQTTSSEEYDSCAPDPSIQGEFPRTRGVYEIKIPQWHNVGREAVSRLCQVPLSPCARLQAFIGRRDHKAKPVGCMFSTRRWSFWAITQLYMSRPHDSYSAYLEIYQVLTDAQHSKNSNLFGPSSCGPFLSYCRLAVFGPRKQIPST